MGRPPSRTAGRAPTGLARGGRLRPTTHGAPGKQREAPREGEAGDVEAEREAHAAERGGAVELQPPGSGRPAGADPGVGRGGR